MSLDSNYISYHIISLFFFFFVAREVPQGGRDGAKGGGEEIDK